MLPKFDIVTLFHLCEYYDDSGDDKAPYGVRGQGTETDAETALNSAHARLNDVKLLELFLSKLNQGGKMLFFTRSRAYGRHHSRAADIVGEVVGSKRMVIEEGYETLMICGLP